MPSEVKIICDGCGADLTYTGNSVDYYLILYYASKIPRYMKNGETGGAVTDMMIQPPIKKAAYFCGLGCLDKWRAAVYPLSTYRFEIALLPVK